MHLCTHAQEYNMISYLKKNRKENIFLHRLTRSFCIKRFVLFRIFQSTTSTCSSS